MRYLKALFAFVGAVGAALAVPIESGAITGPNWIAALLGGLVAAAGVYAIPYAGDYRRDQVGQPGR